MKKLNSTSDFNQQRKEHLLRMYRRSLAEQSKINAKKAYSFAAESPAPRFWVSEERAAEVISKILTDPCFTAGMFKEKAEMYMEIYRRIKKLRAVYPKAPLSALIFKVVNSNAPKSYISRSRTEAILRNS